MTDVVNFFQNILMNHSINTNRTNGTNGTNRNNDSITDHAMKYKEYKKNKEKEKRKQRENVFLSQGEKFLSYQKQIKNKINLPYMEEGFQNNNPTINNPPINNNENSLVKESNNLLKTTNFASDENTIANLKEQYIDSLEKYQEMMKKVANKNQNYLDRVNPSKNKYLNKNIRIGNKTMYVTNQGVAKWYAGNKHNTMGKNGCPKQNETIHVRNIPWNSEYEKAGATIPTNPPLITGDPMVEGQACGNEGNNIYVNKLIPKHVKTNYLGVYDTNNNPAFEFIGGEPAEPPPSFNGIQNGNFENPKIKDNSYEYINSATRVPGWEFKDNGAVLINNSAAWGYPMPYPFGDQSVSIQKYGSISQILYMPVGTYTLSFYAVGRDCCARDKSFNPVIITLNNEKIHTHTPTGSWAQYSIPINIQKSENYTLMFKGDSYSWDRSTAIQKIELVSSSTTQSNTLSSGTYTFNMCKQSAINHGFQYFGLQDVNPNTSKGYCAVTNDYVGATRQGQDNVAEKMVILWQSNTAGQGVSASLSSQGAIEVFDSTGKTIFSTPNEKSSSGNYLGCYGDREDRAMMKMIIGKYNYESCKEEAVSQNYSLFGLQDSTTGENAQCFLSNDLDQSVRYGKATNCTKLGDGKYSGGTWSNAIYSIDPNGMYYLWVHDDGNMEINRGTGPTDSQGLIWESGTKDKVQEANPLYAQAKGKFGADWVHQGASLSKGDFIGSPSGKCALIMQNDGNLVLCTWQMAPNEQTIAHGKMGGGQGAAALYGLSKVGIQENIGKLAYIDENSELHEYPANDWNFASTYTKVPDTNCSGSDIPNAAYNNSNVEQCETKCNSLEECYGFVLNNDNLCLPKSNTMCGTGTDAFPGTNLYRRNKVPKNIPNGASNKVVNVDSNLFQSYFNGASSIGESYGLANINATGVEEEQLSQMESQVNLLANQISELTNKFKNNNTNVDKQVKVNNEGSQNYVNELSQTKNIIDNMNTELKINNILNDSDIVVLQKNYSYLFWSILAVGVVLLSMNIVKNNNMNK
jgi:hypothetical protein